MSKFPFADTYYIIKNGTEKKKYTKVDKNLAIFLLITVVLVAIDVVATFFL